MLVVYWQEVELFVKAGRDGEAVGGCPVCQRFFMILLTKAEHNRHLSLVVTTVNPARPPPELAAVSNARFPLPVYVPCTTDLVGLWPVSDEVSPHSSVLEQS